MPPGSNYPCSYGSSDTSHLFPLLGLSFLHIFTAHIFTASLLSHFILFYYQMYYLKKKPFLTSQLPLLSTFNINILNSICQLFIISCENRNYTHSMSSNITTATASETIDSSQNIFRGPHSVQNLESLLAIVRQLVGGSVERH